MTQETTAIGLAFDEAAHAYTFHGEPVPGVTTVLEPWSGLEFVDPLTLQAAAEFGTHVHMACDFYNKGILDRSSLDPEIEAYLAGWEKYLEESGAVVVYSEAKVVHPVYKYAGTLDTICRLKKTNRLTDIKTGSAIPKTVGPQTAAYNEAWHAMTGQDRMRRQCVHLMPNDYTVQHLDRPDDWDIFKAALTLYQWKKGLLR